MEGVKKIIVKIAENPILEIDVTKTFTRGSIHDYMLKHPKFKRFQYDSSYDQPCSYIKEDREKRWYRGYLIDYSKKKGENQVVDCIIQVRY